MEEPTIVSFYSLRGGVEQTFDIPVPRGRGGRVGERGLQGLRPGQDSTAFGGAEHVDNPVTRGGGLQGFLPRQVSTASSSHSRDASDDAFTGFFALFHNKNARLGPHSESDLSAEFAPSTPPAQQQSTSLAMERDSWVDGDDVWVRVDSLQGPFWKKQLSDRWQWYPPWSGH